MTNDQMKNDKLLFTHYSLLITLLALILIGCANAQSPAIADTIEYRGTQFGFRLSYPAQWQVLEDPPPLVGDSPTMLHAVTLQPPQDSKSLAIVYIQTLTATQTLDEYVAQQMISLRTNENGATFSEPAAVQLGGLDARATSSADDKSQLRRMVITIKSSRAYAVLWLGPTNEALAAQFETMLQSFAFLP